MAGIGNYTDLVNAVIEYLARDQDTTLIGRIPTWIQLAEAKFNRLLFCRQMEQRSVTITDNTLAEPQYIALPSAFQSMRRIRITSVQGSPRIDYKSGAELDEYRYYRADVPGQPLYFTIFGNEMELCPTPDDAYTIEMIYRQNIPPLDGVNNLSNWLLAFAPDLYLYATLLESAPYIKEDDRIPTWALGFKTALDSTNTLEQTTTFNAGPLIIRPAGVIP
jgi:hypothetical protein